MTIRWAPSAAKHGIDRSDALHAIQTHLFWLREFDEPRVEGAARPDLWIGPTLDMSRMLEVMAELRPPADLFIFHVMEARRKIIDFAERNAS